MDINTFKNQTKNLFRGFVKFSKLEDVLVYTDNLLQNVQKQALLLDFMLRALGLDEGSKSIIYDRWLAGKFHSIQSFASYAHHYLRVQTTFYFAIISNLIGTKSSNTIDLEYLLYLPFTLIFSSADKFHKKMTRLFLNAKQDFIETNQLKMDLARINNYFQFLPKLKKKPIYGSRPP